MAFRAGLLFAVTLLAACAGGDNESNPFSSSLPGGVSFGDTGSSTSTPTTGAATEPGSCGDEVCGADESCLICPADCDECEPSCGDDLCNGDETCETCEQDCDACPGFCGDITCEQPGENCFNCPGDCDVCEAMCGDDICNGAETCESCEQDCDPCPVGCGDKDCLGDETCDSCSLDCGPCAPSCGDDKCNGNETCMTCEQDCDECPPMCGDGTCNGAETCKSCKQDCLDQCTPCPCKDPPDPQNFNNVCHWPPDTPGCPPTQGGYCDPNNDNGYDDADWVKGFNEYNEKCG